MGASDKRLMGQRIRQLRELHGMTQRELAEASGISESALRSFELGANFPKDSYLRKIAQALHVRPEVFEGYSITSEIQLIHTLFNLEDALDLRPQGGASPAVTAVGERSLIRKAFKEWSEKRGQLERGEMTEEQYREWKDAYYPFIQLDPFGEEIPDPYTGKMLEGKERDGAAYSVKMLDMDDEQ